MSNSISSNRSMLKEFLASIATIQGDLSNITAPPFVLAEHSTVELPQYWADHPSIFLAPAKEYDPAKRALLVLKWFLGSLKNQQYAGRKEEDGVKKPLNAFLGELFLGSWKNSDIGETRLVSEQVSHHPPVTACYLWNDKQGIRAEGFTQQEITFSGSVSIKQKGYALLHIDQYTEDYLIPVPNVKVKGVLTGTPYPELAGRYSIISTNGYVSEIKFEGKNLLIGGQKNAFEAKIYHVDRPDEDVYTAKGQWNGSFSMRDARTDSVVDEFDANLQEAIPITVDDISRQDAWESRRAWRHVIDALNRGDMKGTSDAKSVVEQGQRDMRKDEEAHGKVWPRAFFRQVNEDPTFAKLSKVDPEAFAVDNDSAHGRGIWKVNQDKVSNAQRPYHGDLLPTNQRGEDQDLPQANVQQETPNVAPTRDAQPQATPDEKPSECEDRATTIAEDERNKPTKAQVERFLREKYTST